MPINQQMRDQAAGMMGRGPEQMGGGGPPPPAQEPGEVIAQVAMLLQKALELLGNMVGRPGAPQ
ncbi:MAG TPA: hypothetical protein ACFYD4_16740 [Candidatus Wunengus sp. YC61]|uniref:hypothetical protein n=1 Tax=Candidatus Wunengus sp. YC61 TaxID=3367698 RepID=UPI0040283738